MDSEETEKCLCGGAVFDRVQVPRPGHPYVTAFIACRRCGVMYHAPITRSVWTGNDVTPTTPKPRKGQP